MKNQRKQPTDPSPIGPDNFYRLADGPRFFGYRPTVLGEKIMSGEIPRPVSLSDNGRAKGWFGRVIIKWQTERQAKAAEQEAKKP